MNSLNIISARVSPPASPTPSRSNSLGTIGLAVTSKDDNGKRKTNGDWDAQTSSLSTSTAVLPAEPPDMSLNSTAKDTLDRDCERDYDTTFAAAAAEDTPLLQIVTKQAKKASPPQPPPPSAWLIAPKRFASTLIASIRWVFSTLAAPGVYLFAFFYDADGKFAPPLQLRKLSGGYGRNPRKMVPEYEKHLAQGVGEETSGYNENSRTGSVSGSSTPSRRGNEALLRGLSSTLSSGLSESESDRDAQGARRSSESRRHSRLHLLADAGSEEVETPPARKSIKIKLNADEALRQRKHRKTRSMSARGGGNGGAGGQSAASSSATGSSSGTTNISAQLKSPTSPIGALTRYPRTPAPPRPLIPRRQPSYINTASEMATPGQKTLILDLDETLIHSMSKGGRLGTGHMVEVRLNTTYVGVGGQASIGPQHPILYFVHKRPHCDEFLRRISKWFNLVVFTASVQEYADPVIDWLEAERKYFTGRYYRQHCTYRHGAFIKDLSSVEPDLSKVMILDNSPLSYMFHQDNAIPIQGWLSDPTDNELLHLVPLLEGLQYVSDVRALLALRGGEDGQHMA